MEQPADPDDVPLDGDRTLALAYVPVARRAAIEGLWALDLRLARVIRAAREPGLGAIRLAWWRDALRALDDRPAPDEPLLRRIAVDVLPSGLRGADLAPLASGWSPMLEPAVADAAALAEVAEGRGETLFAAAATILTGRPAPAEVWAAGQGWALADIAFGFADPALRSAALAAAAGPLAIARAWRWPGGVRPLGMLAMLAARDVAAGTRAAGSPARALRMIRHRLTGR